MATLNKETYSTVITQSDICTHIESSWQQQQVVKEKIYYYYYLLLLLLSLLLLLLYGINEHIH